MSSVKQQIQEALANPGDRYKLLRCLEELAVYPEFLDFAYLWAPALADQNPGFFQGFLLRHLDGRRHARIVSHILAGLDVPPIWGRLLERGLHDKLTRPHAEWSQAIETALQAEDPISALQRVDSRGMVFEPELALKVYRKLGARAVPFLRKHIHPSRRFCWLMLYLAEFEPLRQEALQGGDEDFAWYLFRQFAGPRDCERELRALVDTPIPIDRLEAAVRLRCPDRVRGLDRSPLLDILETYGRAALPLIEAHLTCSDGFYVLQWARKQDDPTLYWRLFFRYAPFPRWRDEMKAFLQQPGQSMAELQLRLPPPSEDAWPPSALGPWQARELYARWPEGFRTVLRATLPRIEEDTPRWCEMPSLWDSATAAGDDETLDLLSAGMLYRAGPSWDWLHVHADALNCLVDRWERMKSEDYVRHVVAMVAALPHAPDFPLGPHRSRVAVYLGSAHVETWMETPGAVPGLLESRHWTVRGLGLTLLYRATRPDAIVLDHVGMLKTLMLRAPNRGTRRLAVHVLSRVSDPRVDSVFQDAIDSSPQLGVNRLATRALRGTLPVRPALVDPDGVHADVR